MIVFVAQVSDGFWLVPNFTPARTRRPPASGKRAISSRLNRSQAIVSTPRLSSHCREAELLKRLTAMTWSLCPAAAVARHASAASVGPILPPAPRISSGLRTCRMKLTNSGRGRVRRSSSCASFSMSCGGTGGDGGVVMQGFRRVGGENCSLESSSHLRPGQGELLQRVARRQIPAKVHARQHPLPGESMLTRADHGGSVRIRDVPEDFLARAAGQ